MIDPRIMKDMLEQVRLELDMIQVNCNQDPELAYWHGEKSIKLLREVGAFIYRAHRNSGEVK